MKCVWSMTRWLRARQTATYPNPGSWRQSFTLLNPALKFFFPLHGFHLYSPLAAQTLLKPEMVTELRQQLSL